MVDGKRREEWIHTTHLIVSIVNSFRDGRQDAIRFDDVYPYSDKRPVEQPANLADAKEMWLTAVGRKG